MKLLFLAIFGLVLSGNISSQTMNIVCAEGSVSQSHIALISAIYTEMKIPFEISLLPGERRFRV